MKESASRTWVSMSATAVVVMSHGLRGFCPFQVPLGKSKRADARARFEAEK